MLIIGKDFQRQMKDGTQDIAELADHLLKTNSSYELAMSLAELMCTVEAQTPKKVVVSQEDYDAIISLFRVRGLTEDGKLEVRGRKRKGERKED